MFAEHIYHFLVQPLADAYDSHHLQGRRLIFTGLTEAFFTYMKVAFYAALFITFPMFAIQLYIFLAPGLYKKERRLLFPFLIASPLLFIAGCAFVYYWIFPMAWHFFISFESSPTMASSFPIQLEARISEYFSLVMQLMFAFGLSFQLPIVLVFMAKAGIITPATLAKKRKYAIILFLIIGAILTPPDVLSQIGLASALLLLYEISILLCRWIMKQDNVCTTSD